MGIALGIEELHKLFKANGNRLCYWVDNISIGDDIKDFFIKEFVMPNMFLSDIPGYLIGRYHDFQGEAVYVRNIFLSESFFLKLEEKVSRAMGSDGLAKLYGAGKRYGYRFCSIARLPRSEVKFSVRLLYEFIEAIYADSIDTNVDMEQKVLTITTKNLAVTRVNGGGFPIVGGSAGVWAYLLGDFDTIECGVTHIADDRYVLVCGPTERLRESGIRFYESRGAPDIGDMALYRQLNQPPDIIPPTACNLERLLRENVLSNGRGQLQFAFPHERLLSTEISLPYELESLLGSQILYESARESFELIGRDVPKQQDRYSFLADMLTAFGYGIVTVERGVNSEEFRFAGAPWYSTAKDSDFPILRGAIEGFIAGQTESQAKAVYVKSELRDNLTVHINAIV